MPLIAIDDSDKNSLDAIAAKMAVELGTKSVTYAYVIGKLINQYLEAHPK
jgi:hypothetical protein